MDLVENVAAAGFETKGAESVRELANRSRTVERHTQNETKVFKNGDFRKASG